MNCEVKCHLQSLRAHFREGSLSQNADTLKGRGRRVETKSRYGRKILEIINKLKNFFLNCGLISLNTAPMIQDMFLMIIEK